LLPTTRRTKRGVKLVGTDNQHLTIDARQRSRHTLLIGATGTGKTTALESLVRQDIDAGHGVLVIDPHGDLYKRLLKYVCYRKAIGCLRSDVLLFDPSSGQWTLPFDPFQRPTDGDLAVAVERRVNVILKAWKQYDSRETPRLAKTLTVLVAGIMEAGLSILDAGELLKQQATLPRAAVAEAMREPLLANLLTQLSLYRPQDFLSQVESTESRMIPFLISGAIRRIMGLGRSELDAAKAMDDGQIVLVNLAPSRFLSDEQQQIIGGMTINAFYEAAIQREIGSRACNAYVDEAGLFVSEEVGRALEQCRKRGFHLTLCFQEMAQFQSEDARLYKAVTINTGTKIAFATPEREDAQILADNLFDGLAEPEVKYMHRHLNHYLEDIREESYTRTTARRKQWSEQWSEAHGRGTSNGESDGTGGSQSQSLAEGESTQLTQSESEHQTQTTGRSFAIGTSSSVSRGTSTTTGDSRGHSSTKTFSSFEGEETGWTSEGEGSHRDRHTSHTGNEQSEYSSSRAETHSTSDSYGQTRGRAKSQGRSRVYGTSSAQNWTRQRSTSSSYSDTDNEGGAYSYGEDSSDGVTDQPGVRHTPFWEEDPEFWRLEEARWRAAELLMRQPVGHCFARSGNRFLPLQLREPAPVYVLPKTLLRLTGEFYSRHCLPQAEAEARSRSRQRQAAEALKSGRLPGSPWSRQPGRQRPRAAEPPPRVASDPEPIWPEAETVLDSSGREPQPPRRPRRGPAPDLENHAKVEKLVQRFGPDWHKDDTLRRLCEELDRQQVPIAKTWATKPNDRALSWQRARELYPDLVIRSIRDRLKAVKRK
jgi:hypothetical protein